MGICYSSSSGSSRRKEEREWKTENQNTSSKLNIKFRSSHSGSNDFTSFISKFSGGGAAAATAQQHALHHIPSALLVNGATRGACLYTQQGKKGTNQDAMIFWESRDARVSHFLTYTISIPVHERILHMQGLGWGTQFSLNNFCSSKDAIFCGVFDGHGPFGHMVARKVRDKLPLLLRTEWESVTNDYQNCNSQNPKDEVLDDDCCELTEEKGTESFPVIHLPLKKSILKAFKLMDEELKLHPTIDCFCSGTTAVTLVVKGQDLIIGNLGDSRAVLGRRDKDNILTAVQLTVDLKPNLPGEAARIQKYKGRVFALQDEPEVARVWLPNSDSPGLAMARAFGDFCLKDFGLISIPDVYYHRITEKDEFIVLATDGVWDVLTNKEAIDVVAGAPSHATAARALVESATRAWRLKFPTSKIDDCAVICLFLERTGPGDFSQVENVPEEETQTIVQKADSTTTDSVSENHISVPDISEIEQVLTSAEKKLPENVNGRSKRSLAECISAAEDEEWSALEGITRANSLLSIPRFLHMEKRSLSWRKWL